MRNTPSLFIVFIISSIIILSSCADKTRKPIDADPSDVTSESISTALAEDDISDVIPEHPFGKLSDPNTAAYLSETMMIMPDVSHEIQITNDKISAFTPHNTTPIFRLSDKWVSSGSRIDPQSMELYDQNTGTITTLEYPNDFPQWVTSSHSKLTMQNRYYYELKAYEDDTLKLTRIDVQEEKLEVLRVAEDESFSLVGAIFSKLDEDRFLMYYQHRAPEGDVYDYYNVLEVCDIDGNYTEILREGRINAYFAKEEDETEGDGAQHSSPDEKRASSDSVGYYNTAYAVKDGEIYALAHQTISEESKWTLRRFSDTGEELGRIPLNNFGYLEHLSYLDTFSIIGDYMLAGNSINKCFYLIKINNGDDRVIIKSELQSENKRSDEILFGDYCDSFFVFRLHKKGASETPLFVFNPENGEMTKLTFNVNEKIEPYDSILYMRFIYNGDFSCAYRYYPNPDDKYATEAIYYVIDLDSVMSGE